MTPLVIFHADCYDGFAAAWVANGYYKGKAQFHRGVYGEQPPNIVGRDVLIVDFSYDRATMEMLAQQAATLVVFDHHATARERLMGLPDATVVFDTKRSGAGIAWDVLFEGEPRLPLIDRIEDRDTEPFWTGNPRYDDSRLVHAALESYDFDFAVWDKLMSRPLEELAAEGVRLEAKHWKEIRMLLPITRREMRISGMVVPVANLPITLCSDAGLEMAKDAPFAATYMDTPLGRVFSLRSREDGADVSKIAARYGRYFETSGGGHPHAAGFLAPQNWTGDRGPTVALDESAARLAAEDAANESVVVLAQGGETSDGERT